MRKNIIDNLTELHNEPHLVDLSIFTLFAECINGELTIYHFQFEKGVLHAGVRPAKRQPQGQPRCGRMQTL